MKLFNIADLLIIAPLAALFLGAIAPITAKAFRGKELKPFVSLVWGMVGVISAAALNITLVSGYWKLSGLNFMPAFAGALVVDGISIWSAYIIYIITGFVLMMLYESKATRDYQFPEHIFLTMSSAIGMVFVTMANDLIVTFIGIEIMSLSVYLLIALSKEKVLSKEASFKYFVLGGVSSAIFLYGIAFIYGTAGSTSLQDVGAQMSGLFKFSPLFLVGFALMFAGLAFKVSLVPFHGWTPDVYQGAATPVTTFMSTGVKLASFVAFLRFFIYADSTGVLNVPNLMQWVAALTMIGGSLAALRQENLKRMLAYSSIAHSGYIMVGLISASYGFNNDDGTTSMLFYLLSYSLMNIGALAVISVLESREDTLLLADDIKGLAGRSPQLAFVFSVLLLSLAGIPPTLGFFGKFYLLAAAIDHGFYWLALVTVLATAIGVYFYLRPIVLMYMTSGGSAAVSRDTYLSQSIALVMAISLIIFGIFSSPIYNFVKSSVFRSL
ncbi:MAG: NADH-quinone oxidoreductase subunit N [Bdellovibrionales bacterium]|nr:NADH-quinone oxidoreductase subunit N [Bdellovibrionales bacterium]